MTEVWLEHSDPRCSMLVDGYSGSSCLICGESLVPADHIDLREQPDHITGFVCSEGCAIQLVQDLDYTVIPKPVEAAS